MRRDWVRKGGDREREPQKMLWEAEWKGKAKIWSKHVKNGIKCLFHICQC